MAQLYASMQGGPTVIRNMGAVTRSMGDRVADGLRAAGLALQRASQELAPVEYGNLKASAYTRSTGRGFDTVVEVGYTASYALYVHEKVGMVLQGQARQPSPPHMGRYWDPQGRAQAKFLETPSRTMHPQMIAIIRRIANIT